MNIGGQVAGRMIMQSLSAIKSRVCRFGCGVSKLVSSLTRVGNSDSQPNKRKEWEATKFSNGVGYAYISELQVKLATATSPAENERKEQITGYIDLIYSSPELKKGFMSIEDGSGFCHLLRDNSNA